MHITSIESSLRIGSAIQHRRSHVQCKTIGEANASDFLSVSLQLSARYFGAWFDELSRVPNEPFCDSICPWTNRPSPFLFVDVFFPHLRVNQYVYCYTSIYTLCMRAQRASCLSPPVIRSNNRYMRCVYIHSAIRLCSGSIKHSHILYIRRCEWMVEWFILCIRILLQHRLECFFNVAIGSKNTHV